MKQVVLYGSSGCHLCKVAQRKLERVRRFVPFELRVVDVHDSPALQDRYGTIIPVVNVNGRDVLVSKVTEFRLLRVLLP